MNKKRIFFNFYSVATSVESDNDHLIERLSNDFSHFLVNEEEQLSGLVISAFLKAPDMKSVKGKPFFKNSKVEVKEKYPLRYCLYGSEGLSIWNQKLDHASFYSLDLELLHELTYLFILSRVGKLLDLRGLHRIHASGFSIGETLFLGMMSSGEGKSTLTAFLSGHSEFSLYSDDSPLITSKGEVMPFPLRFGFEERGKLPEFWKCKESYTLKRRRFGLKKLFSLRNLNFSIGDSYKFKVVLSAKRTAQGAPSIRKVSRCRCISHVFREGLIGVGLPILVEYFWQKGVSDFILKTRIFLSRLAAFMKLIRSSEHFEIELSEDPVANAEFLIQWCKTRKGT